MIAGYNHRRLEERINSALLSGIAYGCEIPFLHKMSERLLRRGRDAWLSDRQAQWLHAILDRCEASSRISPKLRSSTPATTNRSERVESEFVQETINLSDCITTTEAASLSPISVADTSTAPGSLVTSAEAPVSLRSS